MREPNNYKNKDYIEYELANNKVSFLNKLFIEYPHLEPELNYLNVEAFKEYSKQVTPDNIASKMVQVNTLYNELMIIHLVNFFNGGYKRESSGINI